MANVDVEDKKRIDRPKFTLERKDLGVTISLSFKDASLTTVSSIGITTKKDGFLNVSTHAIVDQQRQRVKQWIGVARKGKESEVFTGELPLSDLLDVHFTFTDLSANTIVDGVIPLNKLSPKKLGNWS